MNVSGPTPIAVIQRPEDMALDLRLNQRIRAEVIQVAGERVFLAIDGVRIVARLTSSEQAAVLAERRMANFVVREISSQQISLQLAQPGTPQAPAAQESAAQIIPNLLNHAGLPVDPANLVIARALLGQGLPVTPELMAELRVVLERAGLTQAAQEETGPKRRHWGQAEAQRAAGLKAAGQLLTAETLDLASQNLPSLIEALQSLRARLVDLAKLRPSPRVASLMENALPYMDSLAVDWSAPAQALGEQLRQAVLVLGRSLERHLTELARQGEAEQAGIEAGNGLLTLINLRREIARGAPHPVLDEIDTFLEVLRQQQFSNARPDRPSLKEHWLAFDFPLATPAPGEGAQPAFHNAHLRIVNAAPGEANPVGPAHIRLVLQVELDEGHHLEVDLTVSGRRVGAWITASNQELRQRITAGEQDLKDSLEKLGYLLKNLRCEIGSSLPENMDETLLRRPGFRINLEA